MFPTNLRTGTRGFFEDGRATQVEEVIECILYVLLKDCLTKMVEYYNKHGITNDESQIEIGIFKEFLKLSTMLFSETDNLNQRVDDAIERYMIIRNNFDEEITDINIQEHNEPNRPIHNCSCEMCYTMSQIEVNWNNWCPSDGFLILLKQSINGLDMNEIINLL